jgi:hypothetical protein
MIGKHHRSERRRSEAGKLNDSDTRERAQKGLRTGRKFTKVTVVRRISDA